MRKILILTAGFGNGHNAAAFNLRDALETVSEDTQVEVLDLFQFCYGRANDMVRKIFLGMVEYTPTLWGSVYSMLDRQGVVGNQMKHFTKLREALRDLLQSTEPDMVVSTYPVYNLFIQQIDQDHWRRPFSQITVITDSLRVHSLWHAAPCDHYVVANPPTAEALARAGVPRDRIHDLGFPVSPRFHELATSQPPPGDPADGEAIRLLYLIHHGRKKTGRILERLLEIPNLHLTLTCGADPVLKGKLVERTEPWRDRVHVLGWTNRMPELLRSSHLAITKAGGAIIQEAIAAGCPLLINQVILGQEEGNAMLVEKLGLGAVAASDDDIVSKVGEAFRNQAALWRRWRRAIQRQSRPDAALRIAEFILQECHPPEAPPNPRLVLFSSSSQPTSLGPSAAARAA